MNHLEFAKSESDALIPSDWEKWCGRLEGIMGHSIDGDSDTDGYSMDEAYEMWEAGYPAHGVAFAFRSRGQYHKPPATDADGKGCWHVWVAGDQSSPHTFYNYEEARTFANRKYDDGMKVCADFA